jgi:SAM-dependent methyltransferase
MVEIDFSQLAEGYRHRIPSAASLGRARRAGADLAVGSHILDIGGGPGHHAAVWVERGHHPVVLDPAVEMARPAVALGLAVVIGVSQALPFTNAVFDLAWFHLSLHYGDWRRALDEAVRVTRVGGRIEIWTLGSDHHERSMLARWFPSVPQIDRARFPHEGEVEAFLSDRVSSAQIVTVIEEKTRPAGEWAAAAEAGFVSTLQLVDAAELETGMAAFRRAYPDPSAEVGYELRFARIVATR